MNTTKYTVTFKMVDTGSPWRNPTTGETGKSVAGHLWYSLVNSVSAMMNFEREYN